ncbi:hypothetical protein ESB00_17515 [Oleiharenicola lentus]|uniref:Sortilin N-terminal domain-containing protein n=1 Tax=Oleiharenicola lentus TaxID=2508720 RepID=A0A4Q1C536_9BACT|nr:sialidase family protein [Oleiharenicola lentus]RXK53491.1 hypothetical protein ESB00_17515 [Oleiharenicola lentus]
MEPRTDSHTGVCHATGIRFTRQGAVHRWRRASIVVAALLIGVAGGRAEDPIRSPERGGGWRVIGPGGGGAMFCPAISPHDPQLVFVACDMTGTYVSRDAGESWRMINLQEIVREFTFDAQEADTIYARGNCLWVSRDRGGSWTKLLPQLTEAAEPVAVGDHADIMQFTRDGRSYQVTMIAADPAISGTVYATAKIGTEARLLSSRDGGRTWLQHSTTVRSPLSLLVDPTSPTTSRKLIVAHAGGLVLVHQQEVVEYPAPNNTIFKEVALAMDRTGDRPILYAITAGENSRLLVSSDLGSHWEDLSAHVQANFPGTRGVDFRTLAAARDYPGVIYLSFKGLVTSDGRERLGVARSDDAGATWNFSWLDPVVQHTMAGSKEAGAIPGWIDAHFGPDWGENPLSMAVDPRNPNRVLATDFGRTLQTTDGARTWQQLYTRAQGNGGWVSRGLDVTNVYGLMFDPFDAQHVFMACTDIGLLHSHDGGESWSPATSAPGLPAQWKNTTYDLIFDPDVRGKVWAAMSGTHDLPREKMWRRRPPTQFGGGILWSEDGGQHWQTARLAIGEAAVTDLLLDHQSPTAQRTLFACAFGYGVLKSVDGGQTWQTRNQGLEDAEPLAWRIYRRTHDRALFLVIFRRSDAVDPASEQIGAIYRSDDDADSWHRLELPTNVTGPTSLIVEHLPRGTLLLAAWGRRAHQSATGDIHGGIFRSTDDGKTWEPVLNTDAHITTLTTDARSGAHYASGFNGKAYRSLDQGGHWQIIAGFDFKWGQRVEPDPKDPGQIYILTYGGGVWHGPSDGPEASAEGRTTTYNPPHP